MNPTWSRILMAGGFAVGIAIVVPLAVIAYALLSGDDGPEAEVARITQTATVSPTATATPRPTPSPAPPTATPESTPQATPEPTEEPPPPPPIVQEPVSPPVEQQAPPLQEQPPPPPPPTEEPLAPTSELPAPTVAPPPPTPTALPPTPEPSSGAAACQAWIDAGQPPNSADLFACISFLTEVCLAYQSDPSVVGGAEACQALDILLGRYPQPPGGAGGQAAIETCIEGDFEGWEGDTLFELCNGQLWIQSSYAYLYHYAYRPDVTIVSTDQGYRMFVEGVSDSILVSQVTDFIRTCIDGEFVGWEGDTVFVLCNGQVWQQASYDYTYHYAYRPDILIYRADSVYRMKVEGVQDTIEVIRLQ